MPDKKPHHMNTPESKKAASDARLRWAEEQPAIGEPSIFVVRLAGPKPFGWEIRKYGSIVLSRSDVGFVSQLAARSAGEKALAEMVADTA